MRDRLPDSPFALPSSGTFLFPPLTGVSSLPPLPAFFPPDSDGPLAAGPGNRGGTARHTSFLSLEPHVKERPSHLLTFERIILSVVFADKTLGRGCDVDWMSRDVGKLGVGSSEEKGEKGAASDTNRARQL